MTAFYNAICGLLKNEKSRKSRLSLKALTANKLRQRKKGSAISLTPNSHGLGKNGFSGNRIPSAKEPVRGKRDGEGVKEIHADTWLLGQK